MVVGEDSLDGNVGPTVDSAEVLGGVDTVEGAVASVDVPVTLESAGSPGELLGPWVEVGTEDSVILLFGWGGPFVESKGRHGTFSGS